jgi:hypothetical protein
MKQTCCFSTLYVKSLYFLRTSLYCPCYNCVTSEIHCVCHGDGGVLSDHSYLSPKDNDVALEHSYVS